MRGVSQPGTMGYKCRPHSITAYFFSFRKEMPPLPQPLSTTQQKLCAGAF